MNERNGIADPAAAQERMTARIAERKKKEAKEWMND
jgi:hypothetical protein